MHNPPISQSTLIGAKQHQNDSHAAADYHRCEKTTLRLTEVRFNTIKNHLNSVTVSDYHFPIRVNRCNLWIVPPHVLTFVPWTAYWQSVPA